MIPSELAKRIRSIQIYTNRSVNGVLAGEYESTFKGRGMEFDEVREYIPGDEIRTIDWNVTARTGSPFIKRFVEERELTVMFVVDLSASGTFGTISRTKNEVAAELCALLAFSAVKNNDKVGLIVFTEIVEMFIPPKKGNTHVLRLIRELLNFTPRKTRTNITSGLDYLGRITKRRAVVFLISDFQDNGYERVMRIMAKRHDLIAVTIADPREVIIPNVGLIEVEDAETGELLLIDTSSRRVRTEYERRSRDRCAALANQLASIGADQININTDTDYVRSIVRFFARREKRVG